MNVPLLDLKSQYLSIKDRVERSVLEVLDSQSYILGPYVERLEEAIALYSGCQLGVGVSSGTDALLLALMTENIGDGDEVITTPFTFFATAGCIHRVGARPLFVDIERPTFNIDAALIEERITGRTRALLPVHLYGQMADMDAIADIARLNELVVIEDAAQAIGAEYNGRRAGSIGHYGCFSFYPSKNLGAAGDGGMVVTNDPQRAHRLKIMRVHGSRPQYYHHLVGGNFRLDAIQAAILHVKLPHLEGWTVARQRNAMLYRQKFHQAGVAIEETDEPVAGKKGLNLPYEKENLRHIYNQFVIRTDRRDQLAEWLKQHNVGTAVYYPIPLHLQSCFSYLGYKPGDFPISEQAAQEVLALPIYPELTEQMMDYVVSVTADFYRRW